MANLKNVIYLSNEDYNILITNGTVTINGQIITYSEDDLYITPDVLASSSEDGLMSSIDKEKLDGIQVGAEVNVQSDWSVIDSSSDAFIKNKPSIPNNSNIENGTGTNAIQEKMADATVDFTGRNPNAEALDSTISTTINTGASGNQSSAFGKNTMALATASFTNGNKTLAKGEESHAEGYQSVTLGDGSHAEGSRTTAYGSQSHSEGIETIAYGNDSHAEGEGTQARGINSHSEGYYTQALGNSSHSEGSNTVANAITAHVEGVSNYIGEQQSDDPSSGSDNPSTQPSGYTPGKGEGSHAEGYDNFVYGVGSHVEGAQNVVNGDFAHAEGVQTTSTGTGSHAEGYRTSTIGTYAHAEGQNTHASGYASHSQGNNSYAKGTCSFTSGQSCEADANFATAIGLGLYTSEESSFVVGKYNESSNAIFVVGNGTDSTHRSNAFEVYQDGHATIGLMGSTTNSVVIKSYVDNLTSVLTYNETMSILTSITMPEGTTISSNNITLPSSVTVSNNNIQL